MGNISVVIVLYLGHTKCIFGGKYNEHVPLIISFDQDNIIHASINA